MTSTPRNDEHATGRRADRDRIRDVGQLARAAIVRAMRANPALTKRQLRVFTAVLEKTLSYTKIHDNVTLGQLAEAANLPTRHVSTEINELARRGIIGWEPTKGGRRVGGGGALSRVSLEPRPTLVVVQPRPRMVVVGESAQPQPRPFSAANHDRNDPSTTTGAGRTTEENREDTERTYDFATRTHTCGASPEIDDAPSVHDFDRFEALDLLEGEPF